MPLTRQDIIDYAMLHSGQWLSGFESTFLTNSMVDMIIRREVSVYSKHRPTKKTEGFRLYNGKSFANESHTPVQIFEIRGRNTPSALMTGMASSWGLVPSVYWRYDNPVLSFSLTSDVYQVGYFYTPKYVDGVIEEFDITEERFLDMVTGKFMSTIGRSRRAFKITELPIDFDFDYLIQDGDALYAEAKEAIQEGSDFWLAIF